MKLNLAFLLPALVGAGLAQALMAAPPAPAAVKAQPDGSALYRQRCNTCHSLTPGQNNPAGPNLAGIVGRDAAAGAFRYSPALRGSKLTWTPAKLDEFLAGPSALVPGTRMMVDIRDAAERKAIVDFLANGKS